MTFDVTVDRFRWPDIAAAVRIEAASFPAGAWHAESFWNELAPGPDQSVYLAARTGEELIGYIGVKLDADDAHLHTLTVDQAWRGNGIARKLLRAALNELIVRPCHRWLLEVSEHNDAALALYRGFGFRELALRTDYYARGDSAIVMELGLGDLDLATGEVHG